MVQHADARIIVAVQDTTLQSHQADDIGNQRCIVLNVRCGLEILDVATNASEVLLEVNQETRGGVLVIVEGVVVERIAQRRGDCRAALQFLTHRQRGFAVEITAQRRGEACNRCQTRIDACRGRIVGRRQRVVITIRQRRGQRDLLLIDRITQLQRQVFTELEAEARAETHRLGVVRHERVGELFALEQIEAERYAIVEKIGLDDRQRVTASILAILHRRLRIKATAEKITLRDRNFGKRAIRCRIATRDREVAGGLFFEIDNQNHTVAGRAGFGGDLHGLEEIEILQATLGPIDQRAVIRITF